MSIKTVPTVYQQCTNRQNSQKQLKDSQNSKHDHWCTNCHMSTKTVPTVYQQCTKKVERQSKQQKLPLLYCLLRVRRIHEVRVRRPRPRPPNTQSPAAASSTLEEWTRTFSRGQQCTVVLELPYSTEFWHGRAAI